MEDGRGRGWKFGEFWDVEVDRTDGDGWSCLAELVDSRLLVV